MTSTNFYTSSMVGYLWASKEVLKNFFGSIEFLEMIWNILKFQQTGFTPVQKAKKVLFDNSVYFFFEYDRIKCVEHSADIR